MLLFINGIYKGVMCNHVGYWIDDYESAFELLSRLVNNNWTLQQATIIDAKDRLNVPLEAIDGAPIQPHIRLLQRQWQRILTSRSQTGPAQTDTKQQLKSWYMNLDTYYNDTLARLRKTISSLETKQSTLVVKLSNESMRLAINNQYDTLLNSNRRIYRQMEENWRKNKLRLLQLDRELSER